VHAGAGDVERDQVRRIRWGRIRVGVQNRWCW
jgi:hypothetical protein